eukprot:CAMPEP_0182888282 /NCGR_PEP_ID=MMETSP0034_2-20130328/21337_1 /TAXON_ID=156128 /ORGANISM="Nephroselmis pyriformis, Strain CCMP717" /LENGTH=146 /DNA_ID=CAMNT_0025021701 /DNA_START=101 /DNA_END=542 /DNA_ORIENTATION=+
MIKAVGHAVIHVLERPWGGVVHPQLNRVGQRATLVGILRPPPHHLLLRAPERAPWLLPRPRARVATSLQIHPHLRVCELREVLVLQEHASALLEFPSHTALLHSVDDIVIVQVWAAEVNQPALPAAGARVRLRLGHLHVLLPEEGL